MKVKRQGQSGFPSDPPIGRCIQTHGKEVVAVGLGAVVGAVPEEEVQVQAVQVHLGESVNQGGRGCRWC